MSCIQQEILQRILLLPRRVLALHAVAERRAGLGRRVLRVLGRGQRRKQRRREDEHLHPRPPLHPARGQPARRGQPRIRQRVPDGAVAQRPGGVRGGGLPPAGQSQQEPLPQRGRM